MSVYKTNLNIIFDDWYIFTFLYKKKGNESELINGSGWNVVLSNNTKTTVLLHMGQRRKMISKK